jgi:hypothetical protein
MTFLELIAAAEKGAASVYHAILATGAEIATWESNPLVQPLVDMGVSAANGMLARVGVPTGTLGVVSDDIHAALKQIAAADPTVPSIGGLLSLAGSVASVLVPGVGPAIAVGVAAAEGVVNIMEGVAQPAAPPAAQPA